MIEATRHLMTDFTIPIVVNIIFLPMAAFLIVAPIAGAIGTARFLYWRLFTSRRGQAWIP